MIGGLGGVLKAVQDHKRSLLKGTSSLKKDFKTTLSLSFPTFSFKAGLLKWIGTPKKAGFQDHPAFRKAALTIIPRHRESGNCKSGGNNTVNGRNKREYSHCFP